MRTKHVHGLRQSSTTSFGISGEKNHASVKIRNAQMTVSTVLDLKKQKKMLPGFYMIISTK